VMSARSAGSNRIFRARSDSSRILNLSTSTIVSKASPVRGSESKAPAVVGPKDPLLLRRASVE
jgi:hypothetical protein